MFKVGDKVRRVVGEYNYMIPGDIGTVVAIAHRGNVVLKEYGGVHDVKNLELVAAKTSLDVQVGGSHYKSLNIQPVEYIMANNIPYMEGNIIKYVTRWRDKAGIQDLEKAKHYIEMLIEQEKKNA